MNGNTITVTQVALWNRVKAQCLSANPLVDSDSRTIMCPRCEKVQSEKDFSRLGMNPRFTEYLATINKCPLCGHLFAPVI